MSNNRFTISEQEKSEIKKLYVLNEQEINTKIRVPSTGEGSQGYRRPGTEDSDWVSVTKTQTLPSGLFLNGVDKIDTNSSEYKSALSRIQTVLNMSKDSVPITITGGASKVGQLSGYNNKDLADRRASNFIVALQNSLGNSFSRLKITKNGVVGNSDKKNSPEANKEQFVQISYPEKQDILRINTTTAVDNTDVATTIKGGDMRFKKTNPVPAGNQFMIVKLWYSGDKNEFKNKILKGTGSPAHELSPNDYDDAEGLTFL